jgi:large subunit ribosomal protein L4e
MELKILTLTKTEAGKKKLPAQFSEIVRADLIKRAVEAIQSHNRQKYGASPRAGKRYSANISKRRRDYRGCYGHGISRVPRKIMTRRGERMNWIGAIVPGTRGGRRAHPPKAEKEWCKKINKKERKKAIRSALAAAINKDIVIERGHKAPDHYPFIIESKIEEVDKTKKAKDILEKLGLKEELERVSVKKVRSGKGKNRGRKYKRKTGPLLVVSDTCKLSKSAANIPGVSVINIKELNAEALAPGTIPGRLTLFTDNAIEKLIKEKLFM